MRSRYGDDGPRDVDHVLEEVSGAFRRNARKLGPILVIGLLAVLGLSGVYSVGPGEQGVVRTFGKEVGRSAPGLHYRIPLVQEVDVVNVEQVRRIEIGFRAEKRIPNEALMITGDENLVEAQMIVQYRVADPSLYLFKVKDPEDTLRAAAEVSLRSQVGRTQIDDVITVGRELVQTDTREMLQHLMDDYGSGISVTEVKLLVVDAPDEVRDAFHDVVRAREEKEKLINQAKGYQADLIPRARGEARKHEREAEGYKEERVLRANGDANKFNSMYAEYAKAERVTRERMYLETMEGILGRIEKTVIIDRDVANGTVPILPLGPTQSQGAVVAAQGAR